MSSWETCASLSGRNRVFSHDLDGLSALAFTILRLFLSSPTPSPPSPSLSLVFAFPLAVVKRRPLIARLDTLLGVLIAQHTRATVAVFYITAVSFMLLDLSADTGTEAYAS